MTMDGGAGRGRTETSSRTPGCWFGGGGGGFSIERLQSPACQAGREVLQRTKFSGTTTSL